MHCFAHYRFFLRLFLFYSFAISALPPELSVDLTTPEWKKKLSSLPVVVVHLKKEATYHAPKKFKAYPFLKVWELFEKSISKKLPAESTVKMISWDGYLKQAKLGTLLNEHAFLAFADVDATPPDVWVKFVEGSREQTPAPYYLIWDYPEYREDLPWPFNLVKIEIPSSLEKDQTIPQTKEAKVLAGKKIFSLKCSGCHSINGQGGHLGPELNIPKNIAEIWPKEHLKGFIKNPLEYRRLSSMPYLGYFHDTELEEIYAYLHFMRQQKVCDTLAKCEKYFKNGK